MANPKNHGKPWTTAQKRKLAQLAPTRPAGIIAWLLGRSKAAIYGQASAQGTSLKPTNRSPHNRRGGR
jgi:hypothetical protein